MNRPVSVDVLVIERTRFDPEDPPPHGLTWPFAPGDSYEETVAVLAMAYTITMEVWL